MLTNDNAALIVLDVQKIYTTSDSELFCEENEKTISQINRLIDDFARRGRPIVLVRHIHARDGSDLGRMFDFAGPAEDFNFKEGSDEVEYDQRLHRPKGVHEVVKSRYSALQGTSLESHLRREKINHLVICGFMTNFCCESTARDAHDRDYYVTFIPDATGCPQLPELSQEKIRTLVGQFLEGGIAVIKTTDEFLGSKP
jgi:nicotinamidase-related amidase